jgi:hypothetical protein
MIQLSDDARAEVLAMIRRAKLSHVRWRAYAQGMVAGVPVDDERVPVQHTDCQFGQWYFGDGMKHLANVPTYVRLRGPHETLHGVYAEIHHLIGKQDFSQASAKLEELVRASRELLELMDVLEKEASE